jgi:hypothetical protein
MDARMARQRVRALPATFHIYVVFGLSRDWRCLASPSGESCAACKRERGEMDTSIKDPMGSGLPNEADVMLREAPPPPFDWIREGTSAWMFSEDGSFGMPRIGVEAEPHTWDNRLCQSNFVFADGRQLIKLGRGPAPSIIDENGNPMIMGAGPLTFRCIEPFHRWLVTFDGEVYESHVSEQIDGSADIAKHIAGTLGPESKRQLKYSFEMTAAAPAHVMDHSPEKFFKFGKGKQRDAASVGLGWRFEQVMRGEGELTVDGKNRSIRLNGSRIKRRSVRTESLFLRGHCWQTVVFPDGSAVGYEARPVHDDGQEPYNVGFVWKDGTMHEARATKMPWLRKLLERGDDVSFDLECDLGTIHIGGVSEMTTYMLMSRNMHGLDLHQGGALYSWGDQQGYGMVERSATPGQIPRT